MFATQLRIKNLHLLFCMVVLGFVIACSQGCNNAEEVPVPTEVIPGDTAMVTPDSSGGTTVDTIATKPERNPDTGLVEPVKKSATLGYSYYPSMKRGETKTIRALVAINHPESKIRDTIRRIEKIQTIESPGNDTSTINIINDIPFYKKINISIDSTSDFSIRAIRPASQEIDTIRGNLWLWQVTAKTDKKVAGLTILVDAETPQGAIENIDIREINIRIEIDKVTFIRAAINYLGDNPKVSIPLLAGLVAFIGWLIRYYLEKKKQAGSGGA